MTASDAPVAFGEFFGAEAAIAASLSRYAAGATAPRHRHERPYVSIVLRGGFAQRAACDSHGRPGHLIVLPAGIWHSDVVGREGALCLNLHLAQSEAEALLPRRGPASLGAQRLAGEFGAEIAVGVDRDALAMESLERELLDALGDRPAGRPVPGAVAEVIRLIENAPAQPWRLGALAAQVRRHPTHLAREFRRCTGMGIGAFRRLRVLTALCLDLRCGDRPLADLALEHGFSDQPHMSRALRRFADIAPGRYRRHFRAGALPAFKTPAGGRS